MFFQDLRWKTHIIMRFKKEALFAKKIGNGSIKFSYLSFHFEGFRWFSGCQIWWKFCLEFLEGLEKAKIWQPRKLKVPRKYSIFRKAFLWSTFKWKFFRNFVLTFRVFGVGFNLVNFCAFKFLLALSFWAF
jgi:hypothetical protein